MSERRLEELDTHENRLVKRVIRDALSLVQSFQDREFTNPTLREELLAMREELEWMASFPFLREVEELTIPPFQSSVMQRREGYRDFLRHYVNLAAASKLAGTTNLWERLLDSKDSALLYELWSFFEVKRSLEKWLGAPRCTRLTVHNDERRIVPWEVKAEYADGVELTYNESFGRQTGSYSVTFRPDVVVRKFIEGREHCLVLDAKLKFDGARLVDLEDYDPDDWPRSATRADLYKMHTYRDALEHAVGAFVLYPGTKLVRYAPTSSSVSYEGIGAVPMVPGQESQQLGELLRAYLGIQPTE